MSTPRIWGAQQEIEVFFFHIYCTGFSTDFPVWHSTVHRPVDKICGEVSGARAASEGALATKQTSTELRLGTGEGPLEVSVRGALPRPQVLDIAPWGATDSRD